MAGSTPISPTPAPTPDAVQAFLVKAQAWLTSFFANFKADAAVLATDFKAALQVAADDLPSIESAITTIATITAAFVPGGQIAPFLATIANTVLGLDTAVLTAQGVIMSPTTAMNISPQVAATATKPTNAQLQAEAVRLIKVAFPMVPEGVIAPHVAIAVATAHKIAPAKASS